VLAIWRRHVGLDTPNRLAREAWWFLEPYVMQADAYVFSREAFVWEELDPRRRAIIAPSIDVFSPTNQELDEDEVTGILAAAGLQQADVGRPEFRRLDGARAAVRSRAQLIEERPLKPGKRYVLQVSRWDALKDPSGVIEGFARHVAGAADAHLICAGPDVTAVADDPEGAGVFAAARRCVARTARRRS
jgi:trehalose synthase